MTSEQKAKRKALDELVKPYAELGIAQWGELNSKEQGEAEEALGGRVDIATNAPQANRAINKPFEPGSRAKLLLIPMPHPPKRAFRAFFALVKNTRGDPSFDMVILPANEGCPVAFRFEPGEQESSTHKYEHVQLSRKIGHKSIQLPNIPEWIPDSYPAFPIPSNDLASRFLTMLIAMHGYPEKVEDLLEKMFKGKRERNYQQLMKSMLGGSPDG